jgi:hypothetical protein
MPDDRPESESWDSFVAQLSEVPDELLVEFIRRLIRRAPEAVLHGAIADASLARRDIPTEAVLQLTTVIQRIRRRL